jgi:apolipoprotein N-acyltransferase
VRNSPIISRPAVKALISRHPTLMALLAGAVSATGFAPLGFWPVTLVMVALLLQLVWAAPDRKSAGRIGYAFGVGHFTLGLNWIAHAFTFQDAMPHWLGYPAVFILSLYLAAYPAAAVVIGWTLGRGRPQLFALFFATAWLLTEFLRATLFTGFAWNPLGAIWLGTGVDQLAMTLGTYGLGLISVLTAGALWWLAHRQWRQGVLVVGGLTLVAILGILRAGAIEDGAEGTALASVKVVQPNINQNEKYDAALEELNFRRLSELSTKQKAQAALVFWPEAAVPAILDLEPRWRGRIASLLEVDDLLLLGGDKFHFRDELNGARELEGANNSLWVLDAHGDLLGRYDKAHLVPFGEYLPFRQALEAIGLSRLVPGTVDFWPGPGPRTLDLPAAGDRRSLRMAVQICYEIVFSGKIIDRANRPDFLFNPSNDAWFGSWGPAQHLAQARLRAIEEGIPIIRSTPTGISALISPTGRIIDKVPAGQAGAFVAQLPPALPPTIFSRYGNIIPVGLAVILLVSGVAIARRNR